MRKRERERERVIEKERGSEKERERERERNSIRERLCFTEDFTECRCQLWSNEAEVSKCQNHEVLRRLWKTANFGI